MINMRVRLFDYCTHPLSTLPSPPPPDLRFPRRFERDSRNDIKLLLSGAVPLAVNATNTVRSLSALFTPNYTLGASRARRPVRPAD